MTSLFNDHRKKKTLDQGRSSGAMYSKCSEGGDVALGLPLNENMAVKTGI